MNRILITGARVINGTGSPPLADGAILVEQDRILAVDRVERFQGAADLRRIDCSGQSLLPGLIDCHNHLSMDPDLPDYLHRMADPLPELTIRAVRNLAVDLMAGVTTARCMGDKGFLDTACKKAVEAGEVPGPRLLVAGRGIRMSHGHGFVGYPFDGPEPIRRAVRENLAAGADHIKFYATGTLKGAGPVHSYISPEEIRLIVDEAHRTGKRTAVHCIGGQGLQWCLEAGVDTIEHGYFVTDEEIALLAQSESWLVLTPSIFLTEKRIRTLPPGLIQGHFQEQDLARSRMAAAMAGGVKFAAGTDGMHGELAQELSYLVEMGATPLAAIQAATANAAAALGMGETIGVLAPGKQADVIGVAGNPLEDISALGRVRTVFTRGRIARSS